MDRIVYVLACLIAAGLSGCLGEVDAPSGAQSDEFPMHVIRMDASGCAAYVCVADPESQKARDLYDEYGYEQLTEDDSAPAQGFIRPDGDWLAWVASHASTQGPDEMFARNDMFAMHVPSREVYGVSVGPGEAVRPYIDDGRVVFHYSSANYTGLARWDVGDDFVYKVDFPLQGRYWLWGIEGPWIATSVGTANVTKEVAWNMDTGELVEIFEEEPRNDTTQLHNVEINAEAAYFVHRVGFGTLEHENYLHRVELPTGEHTKVRIDIGYGVVAVGPKEVLLTSFDEYTVYNPDNDTFWDTGMQVDNDHDGYGDCDAPRIGGEVVLFLCDPGEPVYRLYAFANHTSWDVPVVYGGRMVSVGAGTNGEAIFEYRSYGHEPDLYMAPL